MNRVSIIYRIAKRLIDNGFLPKEALVKAKRMVAKHPTAEQIKMIREWYRRAKNADS
jgi:hypothetical protein